MIQVTISRDGQITNQASFPSQEEADSWLAYHNFSGDIEILDISAKLEQERINAEAQAFLNSTDWKVVRAAERGEELSPEFKAEREAARAAIIK